MAVPTITGLTPDNGLTRGDNIVRIAGANFRLPSAVPALGYLGGEQQKTVSVQFDGQESLWAYSATDGLILARVPEYRGPHGVPFPVAQSVRVANLDDNGDEIAGEVVVAAGAYSVDRPGLVEESYFQRVVRAFVHVFKRHVIPDVFVCVSRDAANQHFDDTRLQAKAPAVYLIGPSTQVNRFDSINREEATEDPSDPDQWYRKRYPVTLDLEFDVAIYATTERHLLALSQACILLFRDITEVRVPDLEGQTEPYKDYEIEMMRTFHPDIDDEPNRSDLYKSRAGVMIRGVHIDDADGTIIQRGWRITDNDGLPVVDMQSIAQSTEQIP